MFYTGFKNFGGGKDLFSLLLDVLPRHQVGSPGAWDSPGRGRRRLLAALARIAAHGAGQSVPNSDVVINTKQYSTCSWEREKWLCCYCPI